MKRHFYALFLSLFSAAICLATSECESADSSPQQDKLSAQVRTLDIKAITARPTADSPQYENKEVWPTRVGDEPFQKQEWPTGRLLIWNVYGDAEMIPGNRGGLDGRNPKNWINAATGEPAKSIPDMDTDIILPDSDTTYVVNFHCVEGTKISFCRHMTVGRNATIRLGGHPHNSSIRFLGNVWVRPTGTIVTYGHMYYVGANDTFLRQDWPQDGKLKKMHDERIIAPYDPDAHLFDQPWANGRITYFFIHDKAAGKSTEVIGYVCAVDEVRIKSGAFIVGRDSRFISLGPAAVTVSKGAKVVLMDGSQCSHGQNQFVNKDWNVAVGAEVTGGTPDRPLQRNAYFGVGYRNWQNLPIPERDNRAKQPTDEPKLYYGYTGTNAWIQGDLIGYPASGSDARLVVCWQRISSGGAGAWGRTDEGFKKVFAKITPKITIQVESAKIENVRFDDLHRGGIQTSNADIYKSEGWKNVTFGDGCLSKDPKELFREINPGKGRAQTPDKKYTTL